VPDEVRQKAEREAERLGKMPPMAAEAVVVRTYLEWLLALPWNKVTEDRLDLDRAEQILNEDHYGLKKVKERILEYLAVRKLANKMKGPILCLVGPPGVGKTSLAKSVARLSTVASFAFLWGAYVMRPKLEAIAVLMWEPYQAELFRECVKLILRIRYFCLMKSTK